jgi:putative endonuclease
VTRPTQPLGAYGEDAAARLYEERGFRIIARNHRTRRGEVDLVADDGKLLAFVEVRSRATAAFGSPAATVTAAKQRRFTLAARDFLAKYQGGDREVRFDVVALVSGPAGDELQLIPGAFDAVE